MYTTEPCYSQISPQNLATPFPQSSPASVIHYYCLACFLERASHSLHASSSRTRSHSVVQAARCASLDLVVPTSDAGI
ncbi:hypothetical protein BaRGS_00034964, partial [Batillaria attramentaria]